MQPLPVAVSCVRLGVAKAALGSCLDSYGVGLEISGVILGRFKCCFQMQPEIIGHLGNIAVLALCLHQFTGTCSQPPSEAGSCPPGFSGLTQYC